MATISFELPDRFLEHLADTVANVDGAAKEAPLVEMFRQGHLSHGTLAECLGVCRDELDAILRRHHVTEDLQTVEEFERDLAEVRRLLVR